MQAVTKVNAINGDNGYSMVVVVVVVTGLIVFYLFIFSFMPPFS